MLTRVILASFRLLCRLRLEAKVLQIRSAAQPTEETTRLRTSPPRRRAPRCLRGAHPPPRHLTSTAYETQARRDGGTRDRTVGASHPHERGACVLRRVIGSSHGLRRRESLALSAARGPGWEYEGGLCVSESEFFDLLATSPTRWRTLRMSGREWRDLTLARQAWAARKRQRLAGGMPVPTSALGRMERPEPREHEETWSLWLAPPQRRAIFAFGTGTVDVVFHETTWWSYGPTGFSSNEGRSRHEHGLGWGEQLVRTPDYATGFSVQHVQTGSRLGRATLEARVTTVHPPPERGRGLHGLVIGDADMIDLSVDRERGVILRATSWIQHSVYRILEALDVAFDEVFPPDTFKIEPPPGWKPPPARERL